MYLSWQIMMKKRQRMKAIDVKIILRLFGWFRKNNLYAISDYVEKISMGNNMAALTVTPVKHVNIFIIIIVSTSEKVRRRIINQP